MLNFVRNKKTTPAEVAFFSHGENKKVFSFPESGKGNKSNFD